MSTVVTYSEARQNLASLLDRALTDSEVYIKRKDGRMFVLKPVEIKTSPLDVEGVDLGVSTEEIIDFIAEARRFSS